MVNRERQVTTAKYEAELLHMAGHRWHYSDDDAKLIKRSADKAIRRLGGSLSHEVSYHPGSFVYTDGEQAVALLVIRKQ